MPTSNSDINALNVRQGLDQQYIGMDQQTYISPYVQACSKPKEHLSAREWLGDELKRLALLRDSKMDQVDRTRAALDALEADRDAVVGRILDLRGELSRLM